MDRRGFLECMAWVGTGVVWTSAGGVLSSRTLAHAGEASAGGDFSFVQISDTHIGFTGEANKDVTRTLQEALTAVNALPTPPAFVLHTGDLTHAQKPGAFDAVAELLKTVRTERVFFVPGENDVFLDGGKEYLGRYGKGTAGGRGWQSFDYRGVHFIGLVNVLTYKADGLGSLGPEQLEWLEDDVRALPSSTPVVVFGHVPLWAVYPAWGWATGDSERALGYLRRFSTVTSIRSCRRSRAASRSTPRCPRRSPSPRPEPRPGP